MFIRRYFRDNVPNANRIASMPSRIETMREAAMPDREFDFAERSRLRETALSRWENEGGAGADRLQALSGVPRLTNAELVQLQIRVIALENLVITLLAEASDRQLALAREMAVFISPRPGFTAHRLTIHAQREMISLVDRAGHFRGMQTG
jgi:hypothetical protein